MTACNEKKECQKSSGVGKQSLVPQRAAPYIGSGTRFDVDARTIIMCQLPGRVIYLAAPPHAPPHAPPRWSHVVRRLE